MESPQTTAENTAATTGDANNQTSAPEDRETKTTAGVNTEEVMEPKTPAPLPSRGDGPDNLPQVNTIWSKLWQIIHIQGFLKNNK